MSRWLIALALVAAASCAGDARTCDDLAGVWRDPAGKRYHLVANKSGYEGYALFDSARPPDGSDKRSSEVIWAPWVIDLRAKGSGELVGLWSQRGTRGARDCRRKRRVTGSCRGGRELRLRLARAGEVDWETCQTAPAAGADELRLTRAGD